MINEVEEKLSLLLQGEIPPQIALNHSAPEDERTLAATLNRLILFMQEMHEFIIPLSRGELHDIRPQPGNFLASPFRELHSRLRHLTWQAEQVATGDFKQRVDFMGDFSEAFNSMIVALDHNDTLLKKKVTELEQALSRIKSLEGILPICSYCKKIRTEGADPGEPDNWVQMESYISTRTDALFSHSICPTCLEKVYPEHKR